jgi:hypothetical protein
MSTTNNTSTDAGIEMAARCLASYEARHLAGELDRRGGGFTAHTAALLRAKAERWDREADYITSTVHDE